MLEENTIQGQEQTPIPKANADENNAPQELLSYAEQKSRTNFLQDSSSESDEELFMLQISQKVEQMDNEHESNSSEVPRTRNEKVAPVKIDEIAESKEDRELKFNFSSEGNPQLLEIGYLESIIKDSIIIHPGSTGIILNLDQLVITESKLILGVIEDVFGRIENPHYRILNDPYTQQLIKEEKLRLMDRLYIDSTNQKLLCQDHLQILLKKKGCDASNQFDEEVDDREIEYSDDENEQVHKSKKNKNKNKDKKQDPALKQVIPPNPKQQHIIPSPRAGNPNQQKPYNQRQNPNPNNQFANQHQYQNQKHSNQQQFIPNQQQLNQQQIQTNQKQYSHQQFPNQFQQQQFPVQQQYSQQQQFPAQQQQFPIQQQFQSQFPNPQQQQPPNQQQQNTQLPSQFVQIGAQYFTMLPGGIPNLLNPKENK